METIALNRLHLISLTKGAGVPAKQRVVFLTELAKLGYRVTNPALLDEASPSFLERRDAIIQTLKEKRGGQVKYVPLFKNFPHDIPEDNAYFLKRVIGYLGNAMNWFEDAMVLDNGVKVPKWLFNTYAFGADPITQMQTDELYFLGVQEEEMKAGDTHVVTMDLTLAFEDEVEEALKAYLMQMVYAKASIKEALHPELFRLLDFFGAAELEGNMMVFKETKALVMMYFWEKADYEAVKKLTNTATDMLRMFAAVTSSDVSLSEKIRFPRMTRPDRKAIMSILEGLSGLAEDVRKYKGLWLGIGRYLHPGEYAKAYPRTAAIFDALRNGKIETYASRTERLLALQELELLLTHLEKRPGVFARKLHEVLRWFPDATPQVLDAFRRHAAELPVKNLLVLKAYFATINEATYRTVINKKGKIKVLPNNALGALNLSQRLRVVGLIEDAIHRALETRDSWEAQKVWIDPALASYTVPLQQRKASDGLLTVGRGSRIAADFSKVLRLFVWWKQAEKRTDLDLSVIQFNEDFKYLGHVSYTNLKAGGIVHSGDLQSAPHGAAEFVDITMSRLKPTVKYLAVQVYKYAGENFAEMDCHAGWMERERVNKSVKSFDIKTVVNKFDLNGVGGYAIPLVVDIAAQEIILTDLFVSGRALNNNVEGAQSDVAMICEQIAKFVKTRPVMADLAEAHVWARKAELVDTQEDADISFGVKDCTYNATDVEQVLAELI